MWDGSAAYGYICTCTDMSKLTGGKDFLANLEICIPTGDYLQYSGVQPIFPGREGKHLS